MVSCARETCLSASGGRKGPSAPAQLPPLACATPTAGACLHPQLGHRRGEGGVLPALLLWCGQLRSVVPVLDYAECGARRGPRSNSLCGLEPIHLPPWAPELEAVDKSLAPQRVAH